MVPAMTGLSATLPPRAALRLVFRLLPVPATRAIARRGKVGVAGVLPHLLHEHRDQLLELGDLALELFDSRILGSEIGFEVGDALIAWVHRGA